MIILRITTIVLLFLMLSWSGVSGKVRIDITSPTLKKTPIAVTDFRDLSPSGRSSVKLAGELRDVLAGDMEFTGLFKILDRATYIEEGPNPDINTASPDYRGWRVTGAEFIIMGGLNAYAAAGECETENDILLKLSLFDVRREVRVIRKQYCSPVAELRADMHRFANAVLKELTGEDGIFESRIAFYHSSAPDNREIFISDYDGHNRQVVTKNGSINISPHWSPDGKWLIYTSFKEERRPRLYLHRLSTGKAYMIAKYKGINIGGRWSPSGKKIALTLSIDGNPELYTLDLKSKRLRRLTNNSGIDVSPTWSPDGRRIAYVTDRGGNPNIFVMDRDGSNVRRLTYEGKFNVSPAWSPAGKYIAFSRMEGGRFDIWVLSLDGTMLRQLTFGPGNNEDPSWSPDGRHIAFKSDRDGEPYIYTMRADGSGERRVIPGNSPSWSP